jgi:hypothetical protein
VRTSPLAVHLSLSHCRAHVVSVVPSPRLCRRRFARAHHHRAEALFFLARPVCAHSCARESVRRRLCLTSTAGLFLAVPLSLFPCLSHAISFVSPPWPRRRCSARTRTHATEGPSPCFTYLQPCSTFHRAVTANPYAPAHMCPSSHRPQVRTFLATATLNTASPKSARRALVSLSSPCTRHRFRVAAVATPPTSAQMRTHTPEGSYPSALPVQPMCAHPPG